MRKSRFSEAQIVAILREADRGPVGEVAKKHGVSEQSIYTWRMHCLLWMSGKRARRRLPVEGDQNKQTFRGNSSEGRCRGG